MGKKVCISYVMAAIFDGVHFCVHFSIASKELVRVTTVPI